MVYSSVTVCWCREKEWRHLEIKWRRCSYVRIIRITGILILCELLSLILFFAVSRFGVPHVHHTSSANELYTMICLDIHVVEAICLVAADAEKAIALNCLCSEVFLCFGNSVASTRFMLQDEFNLQTTKCDNCIIGFMFCLQQLACICSIIACLTGSEEIQDAAQLLNCLSDLVYCSVCSCMQHKVEMDKRDGKFGPRPMAVPPVQQMSRLDQPVPPSVGYPPAQPQAYPPMQEPHGYPPPPQQPQGYPPPQQQPQGYPPPQQQPYYPPPGAGYPQ